MMYKLVWSVHGEEQINRELMRFQMDAVDARPAFAAMARDIQDAIKMQFDTEGASGSGGWPPLAESTLKRKRAMGMDRGILRMTDELYDSWTSPLSSFTAGDPNQIFLLLPQSLEFGSRVPYGKYHQSDQPRDTLPQRKIVDLTTSQKTGLTKTLQRFLVTGSVGIRGMA